VNPNTQTKLNINVQEPYFSFIKNGQKTVEGRLAKDKFKSLIKGDIITINDQLDKKVDYVNIYNTFEDILIMEGVINTIPDAKVLKDAVGVYYKFFSKDDENKFKVCAIKLSDI
jgi:ASC-1-like (ASCH) protein